MRFAVRSPQFAVFAVALLSCADAPPLAPVATASFEARPVSIENRYIVLFRDDVADPAALTNTLLAMHGGNLGHVYQFALKGFAVANLSAAAVEALRRNPLVRSIEPAQEMRLHDAQQLPLTGSSYRQSILWALDRVDERADTFDGLYSYSHGGSGTHIYIVDSGVRGGHVEWGYGRIGTSVTKLAWSWGASPTIDQIGHGTGVAGVAAGNTYGIAKCATIHSVRVEDGGGFPCPDGACEEDLIAGIDWVAGNHERPAVMNVSFQGSSAIRSAFEGAIARGVIAIKSAGNAGVDAGQDPANHAQGLIVAGASDRNDYRSSFLNGASNIGSLITLFAPGSAILSADKDSDTDTLSWWGTSFAAPFTAGVAALILQQEPSAPPSRVRELLTTTSTTGELNGNLGAGSPNRLLFSHIITPPPPPPLTSVSIDGPARIQPGDTCTWYAIVGDGSPPYTYYWTNDGAFGGSSSSYSGSKGDGSTGSSFSLRVWVTDAVGRQGDRLITVSEDPSVFPCVQ